MSAMTARTRASASSPAAIVTTRKTAARDSGASTLCGSIGTRFQLASVMGPPLSRNSLLRAG